MKFEVSFSDLLLSLASCLLLQSLCPLSPACSGPRWPTGSLSISTSLWTQVQGIHPHLPPSLSTRFKTGLLKARDIKIFTQHCRKSGTCPTVLCKTPAPDRLTFLFRISLRHTHLSFSQDQTAFLQHLCRAGQYALP